MDTIVKWQKKFNALPRIPRSQSKLGYVDTLKTIFHEINSKKELEATIKIEGSNTNHSLTHYIEILLRYQFIRVDEKNDYYVTESLSNFEDDSFVESLAKFLQTNVKYFSELLRFIEEPKSTREILKDANENYNMSWKQKGQIHERLAWLSDLGLINSMSYKKLYAINQEGRNFIEQFPPMHPINISEYIQDITENEKLIELPEWIGKLNWNANHNEKKDGLGFIPGGRANSTTLILSVLEFTSKAKDTESLNNYIKGKFKYKESSINGFLTFLTNLKIIDRIGEKVYQTSEYGIQLLHSELPDLYLLFFINKEYKYIFEILLVLEEVPQEPKELAARGVTEFNMKSESLDKIRERLAHLKNAKLILNDKGKKLTLSNRGKLLLSILKSKMNFSKSTKERQKNLLKDDVDSYKNLLKEVRLASTNSSNPHDFEKLLEKTFIELGFNTKLLARAGTTDILLTARTVPDYTYKVAVEAKTNKEGKITENLINFDALKEHKYKHNADFVVIVGKSFYGERLKRFAENNKVLLMDLDNLELLVKRHQVYPLQAIEYKKLFNQEGEVDISILDSTYNRMSRDNTLFKSIIQILIENSDDEFTKGILTMREIYMLIKNIDEFKEQDLTKEEVDNMLNLLSNPLIGCVGKENNGYYAKGSLVDAQLKFGFYYSASIK
ncbi:restriction endonuclease [Staphylococcus nepalensis]|uniref:Restriction endonuclease n=2 Tax=Staphylococcus nepalensis TaxID=214473 RepID=A0ABS3L7Q3_9STAP|nr:restriction endonuclease [Staphylococcus nepalensis]MBO1212157.1 restriction endonuclease [Staphylococcus nepalensis]MBO1228419.1 restriction endonuclease [Staphylococcus nepalensis]MBO1235467.1 restriction endonuclease [Staphylococcus nepalensis]